ncbi:hypothetical protein MGU_05736 [Metarhizium guizhouense ARSEF 977]|uniref:Uncharacterized protein n=1 Tax=Metarhizium guizhouense (strain ARSEF 977) TaxID=1276136 RepID=A0A0B4HBW7_METGA|nr:hypothetical protein MGU_05736 [Metarhizium guizhouense ARSEF 977]
MPSRILYEISNPPCDAATTVYGVQKVRYRLHAHIQWKDENGVVTALERRLRRNEDGTVDVLPRLDVILALAEKDLDLLVTCWAARLWKETKGDLKKPVTWEDFKRIVSQKRRFGKTPMLSVGALGLAGASAAF